MSDDLSAFRNMKLNDKSELSERFSELINTLFLSSVTILLNDISDIREELIEYRNGDADNGRTNQTRRR